MLRQRFFVLIFVLGMLSATKGIAAEQSNAKSSNQANGGASALVDSNAAWGIGGSFTTGAQFRVGHGGDAATSFGQTMWGDEPLIGAAYSAAGASTNLFSYAEGGDYGAFSTPITDNTRISLGWTKVDELLSANEDVLEPSSAMAASLGLTTSFQHRVGIGLTATALHQRNGLLNQTYEINQGFGDAHNSGSLGLSTFVKLTSDSIFVLDAASTISDSSSMPDAMLDRVSVYHAHSFGFSYGQSNALTSNDQFIFSISKPLIITSGSMSSGVLSIDDQGYLALVDQKFSARTGGDSETRLAMTYDAPLFNSVSLDTSLMLRRNADNIAGYNSTDLFFNIKTDF